MRVPGYQTTAMAWRMGPTAVLDAGCCLFTALPARTLCTTRPLLWLRMCMMAEFWAFAKLRTAGMALSGKHGRREGGVVGPVDCGGGGGGGVWAHPR